MQRNSLLIALDFFHDTKLLLSSCDVSRSLNPIIKLPSYKRKVKQGNARKHNSKKADNAIPTSLTEICLQHSSLISTKTS